MSRQQELERERVRMLDDIARQREQIEADNAVVPLTGARFVPQSVHSETALKAQTVGLVRLEEFQAIKRALDDRDHAEQEARRAKESKKNKEGKVLLSFGDDVEDDDEEEVEPAPAKASEDKGKAPLPKRKKIKIAKNPDVDTSFLPDKARDERERIERERLRREWEAEQDKVKAEAITVVYSYWDGSGHRAEVECTKGDSIGKFLDKVRQQRPELRSVVVDNLMYVKEDLILPQHHTFYDFIANKARGKSGPLFTFGVKDDVRLVSDARVETEESHAGKVVTRGWYERNKHIFPANRWEIFDPTRDYGRYSYR